MPGDQVACVFQADLTLDHRFGQVTQRADDAANDSEQRRLWHAEGQTKQKYKRYPRHNRAQQAANCAFPRFLWAQARGHFMPAKVLPGKVRGGILDPGNRQHHHNPRRAGVEVHPDGGKRARAAWRLQGAQQDKVAKQTADIKRASQRQRPRRKAVLLAMACQLKHQAANHQQRHQQLPPAKELFHHMIIIHPAARKPDTALVRSITIVPALRGASASRQCWRS